MQVTCRVRDTCMSGHSCYCRTNIRMYIIKRVCVYLNNIRIIYIATIYAYILILYAYIRELFFLAFIQYPFFMKRKYKLWWSSKQYQRSELSHLQTLNTKRPRYMTFEYTQWRYVDIEVTASGPFYW